MRRSFKVLLRTAAFVLPPTLYALSIRPRMLTWGASPAETDGVYPGDELIRDPTSSATMATTLPAPPEEVWPWLVQMGGGRGGWYSWDWLDNDGNPSADRIVPRWQSLARGDHLHRVPKGPANYFTVTVLEPNRSLALRSSYGMFGQAFDPQNDPEPWAFIDGIWGFHLLPTREGRTRLIVRTRSRGRPRWLQRPLNLLVGEPVHFIMQTRQLHNLRLRVSAPHP